MHQYRKQFKTLSKYLKRIQNSRPPIREYINIMSELCQELVEAQYCIFWLYDEESGKIVSQISDEIERYEVDAFEGIIGHVIKSGECRMVNDCSQDPYYNPEIEKITGIKNLSSIYVPLKHSNNEVYGAIQVVNALEDEIFSEDDLELLNFVALYCEEALTSYFFEEELIQTQNDILFLLAELGESRSKETGMHVRRVSAMTELLAELIGLSEEECTMIRLASPLHDLGKVGIQDAVLNKPGKLTDEEYAIMKKHTSIGHSILAPLQRKLLKIADIIALEHHERFDGRGYPNGLKGEEIHLFARITSVCDVFDALANKRSYKLPWPKEQIVAEFTKQKGAQFDPHLVDVFLENIDQFYTILQRYPDDTETA